MITLNPLTKKQWNAISKNCLGSSEFDKIWLKSIAHYYNNQIISGDSDFSVFEAQDNSAIIAYLVVTNDILLNIFAVECLTSQQLKDIFKALKDKGISQRKLRGEPSYPYLVEDDQDRWWHPYRLPSGITLVDDFNASKFKCLAGEVEDVDDLLSGVQLVLPDNLTFRGKLELAGSTKLPDNLTADTILLTKFSGAIGKNLRAKHLTITGRTETLRFDSCQVFDLLLVDMLCSLNLSGVTVENDVSIYSSSYLELSHVTARSLIIYTSGDLKAQIKHIHLTGNLYLETSHVKILGPDVSCASLKLHRVNSIQEITPDLKLGQDLTIDQCANLKSLPQGLIVPGSLSLGDQDYVSLPDNGIVYGDVVLPPSKSPFLNLTIPHSFCCIGTMHHADVHID